MRKLGIPGPAPSSCAKAQGRGCGRAKVHSPAQKFLRKDSRELKILQDSISHHRYPAGDGRTGERDVLLGETEALSIFCLPVVIPWGRDLSWEPRPEMSPKSGRGRRRLSSKAVFIDSV